MMKTRAAAVLIALVWLISHIAEAQAYNYVVGWNFIRAYNCYGFQSGGVDFMYIYPDTLNTPIFTSDPTTITALAPLCVNGDGFFVFLQIVAGKIIWNGVSVYPSIK
jgi:hypothetical protein